MQNSFLIGLNFQNFTGAGGQKEPLEPALGRMGRILGRSGTDVGTDKTHKIINVYRHWDGGTDKLGERRGMALNPKLEARNPKGFYG